MNIKTLKINDTFINDKGSWKITDIGSRVVVAVDISHGWISGPPYNVQELVFNEFDLKSCHQNYDLDHLGLPSDLASDEEFHGIDADDDGQVNVIDISQADIGLEINFDDDSKIEKP